MASIAKPRDIIDRKALLAELEELVGWSGYTPKTQGQVLDIFKTAFNRGWDEVRRQHQIVFPEGLLVLNPSGAAIARRCDGRPAAEFWKQNAAGTR